MSRRYDRNHQAARRALLPFAIGTPCLHCGKPMLADEALDLDHIPGTTRYRGIVHAFCNRQEGGRRGRAKQLARRGGVFPPLT